MRKFIVVSAVVLVFMSMSSLASAITVIPQSSLGYNGGLYYTDIIGGGIGNVVVMTGGGNANGAGNPTGRNDDGYSGPKAMSPFTFFGNTYTSYWANNNGNVTFTGGLSSYIPQGPTGAALPIISAFFADVDTRNLNSGVLHIRTDIPNEIILTWDMVGYYNQVAPPYNNFQMVLRSDAYDIPFGQGKIGFFYKDMGWDVTNTSQTAAVGFGDGLGNGEVIQGSNLPGMAAALQDHFIWFDPLLRPVPTPEPSSVLFISAGLAGLVALRRKFVR